MIGTGEILFVLSLFILAAVLAGIFLAIRALVRLITREDQ